MVSRSSQTQTESDLLHHFFAHHSFPTQLVHQRRLSAPRRSSSSVLFRHLCRRGRSLLYCHRSWQNIEQIDFVQRCSFLEFHSFAGRFRSAFLAAGSVQESFKKQNLITGPNVEQETWEKKGTPSYRSNLMIFY